MKKLAGILLLTAAVILTAGCISTADPIVGTWELTEPLQYDDHSLTYSLTFNEDGKSGMLKETYQYSDEEIYPNYPIVWEKTGENTYRYEAICTLTLSEDKKTLTDWAGYTFALSEGEEVFGGAWTEVTDDEYADIIILNEDGTCLMKSHDSEPAVEEYLWSMLDSNQILIWFYETYVINDEGKLTTSYWDEAVFEEVDGVWTSPRVDEYRTTFQFLDDGDCIQTIYIGNPDEVYGIYYWYFEEAEDGKSGVLKERFIYEVKLLEDGTLVDESSNTLVRVTSA